MKILITGSSGFLGGIIEKRYRDAGHEVFTLSRDSGASFRCDLAQNIPVFDQQFDLVVHAAGKAHVVPKTEEERNDFFRINKTGTQHLLEGLSEKPPAKLAFISTVAVYGVEAGENISESLPLNASDPYGLSKIAAEQDVQRWCTDRKVNYLILRLPLIIGRHARGNLGAMIKGIERGIYFNIGTGATKRSMVLATDVAGIIIVGNKSGIYNLTDGYHPSYKELSELIAKQMGRRKPMSISYWIAKCLAILGNSFPINSNKLSKITETLTFDDSKARNELGWKPNNILNEYKLP
jgi:nucleoside-diphosphate-sugar epimerase